jgi:hypothetical protein
VAGGAARKREYPDAERGLIARGELQRVGSLLDAMPERMRDALVMFRLEQRPQKAIAQELGMSLSGVEKLLGRAYRQLVAGLADPVMEPAAQGSAASMRLIAMSAETHEAPGGAMEAAIAWHVQMPAMDAARWADLVAWLEAAPEHQAAFDRVAAADRLLAAVPGLRQRSGEPPSAMPARRMVACGRWIALAASLAVALWTVAPRDRQPTTFATAAGKMQTVRLAEGTAIVLNGDTRLARGTVSGLSGWMVAKRCSRSAIAPMRLSRWRRAAIALSMSEPCSTSGAMPGG